MNYSSMAFRWKMVIASLIAFLALGSGMSTVQAQVSLFINDDNGVERYDFTTSTLSNLVPSSGDFFGLTGLAIGLNGNLFVAATGPVPQIYQFDPTTGAPIGTPPFVFYEGTPPTPDPHDVINPAGIRFSPLNGNLYVADLSGATANVHIYDATGRHWAH